MIDWAEVIPTLVDAGTTIAVAGILGLLIYAIIKASVPLFKMYAGAADIYAALNQDLRADLERKETRITNLEKSDTRHEAKIAELEEKLEAREAELAAAQAQIQKLEEQLKAVEKDRDKVAKERDELEKRVNELKTEIEELRKRLNHADESKPEDKPEGKTADES